MTALEFVKAVKGGACVAAVESLIANLTSPPGRRPEEALVELSTWYRQLSSEDKEGLHQALRRAADFAVFGVLAILDGVRVVEAYGTKGEFELYYVKGSDRVLLNDPNSVPLHDLLADA